MSKRALRPTYPHDGYLFRPVKVLSTGAELLHCVERKTIIQCGALARRDTNGAITVSKPHAGHDPDDEKVKSKIARDGIKERASTSALPPRDILHETKMKFGVRPVIEAGSTSAIGRMIQRQREEKCDDTAAVDAPNPVFQGKMTKDNDNEKFLLFDEICPSSGKRHVGFASKLELEILEKSKIFLSDGTFDVARPPFLQIWCIHAKFEDVIVPVVHVLMASKSTPDYEFVLQKLKNLIPAWDPTDYLGGSMLHEFWSLLKCLPFGDLTVVEQDFDEICSLLPQTLTTEMQHYLLKFYVKDRPRMIFPPNTWNVVNRSIRHLPRTTNTVEASHRILERCIRSTNGRSSPLLSELLKCLRQESSKRKFDKETLDFDPTYKIASKRKLKDELKDERILAAIRNNQGFQGITYYKAIRAARKYN